MKIKCTCGETGKHVRFRSVCRKTCRFKSCQVHQNLQQGISFVGDFFIFKWQDLNLKKARAVKKNSTVYCFLGEWCEGGYRMRSIGSPSSAYCQRQDASFQVHQKERHDFHRVFLFVFVSVRTQHRLTEGQHHFERSENIVINRRTQNDVVLRTNNVTPCGVNDVMLRINDVAHSANLC